MVKIDSSGMFRSILVSTLMISLPAIAAETKKNGSKEIENLLSGFKQAADGQGKPFSEKELIRLLEENEKKSYTSNRDRTRWVRDVKDIFQGQCVRDEADFAKLESHLINGFRKSILSSNSSDLRKFLAKDLKVRPLAELSGASNTNVDDIVISSWSGDGKPQPGSNVFQQYLSQFSKIEDADLKAFDYKILKRNSNDLSPTNMRLMVRFDVRGLDGKGRRRNDRGIWAISTERNKEGAWLISGLEPEQAETLVLHRQPAFVEKTQAYGLDKLALHPRREAIRRGGFGTAIADINGDGILDMYIGTAGEPEFLLGKPNGGFEKVDVGVLGLGLDTSVKAAIFADLDSDGFPELILTRFEPGKEDIIVYKNDGKGKFSKLNNPISDRIATPWPMPATVADFNGNGYLDFYVGFPGDRDFTNPHYGEPSAGAPQGLFLNSGGLKFSEATKVYKLQSDFMFKWQNFFPHASLAVDFDRDGFMDLIVMDDRGNLSRILRNKKGKEFEDVTRSFNINNRGAGMGVAVADFSGNGKFDIVMSNVNVVAAERLSKACDSNWYRPIVETPLPDTGIRFFEARTGGYVESSVAKGLDWAGEGLSGMVPIDYNNDGLMDLYVVNGLWSGTQRDEDLSSIYARGIMNREASMRLIQSRPAYNHVMKLLVNYRGTIESNKQTSNGGSLSLAGYQRNRLFRNNGDGTFTEVGYLENVDSIADGYMATVADVDGSGRMDLVLRNADPGDERYTFPTVQIFENTFKKNNSLAIRLEGKNSNREAIGATVEVELSDRSGKKTLVQQVPASSGTIQPDKVLIFGLGTRKRADQVTIHWPSGQKQTLKNVKPGQLKVKEAGPVVAGN